MDYGIWSILANSVFCVKLGDLGHLEETLPRAWDALTQVQIDSTIMSFRKRVRACIAAEGKRIEYKL